MKGKGLAMLVAVLSGFCSGYVVGADSHEYDVVHGWPRLPDGFVLGQVTAVDVDSHNHVFVFHRADLAWSSGIPPKPVSKKTILCIDGESGELLSSWGENMFYVPHGLFVDHEDNIWITDLGRHQVLKFSNSGELLMTVGEERVPGLDGQHFNQPTDVAVTPDGSFYVSDGYRNNRIAKFSADGKFLFDWGKRGSGPGEFRLPHSVAVDAKGRVYVADRSNARIQVFDAKGNFITQWKSPELGRPWDVDVGKDGYLYVGGLPGNGVCHLASLMNQVASEAELSITAEVNHNFAQIPGIEKKYGTSIYFLPNGGNSSERQNLYIRNNKDYPVEFEFELEGDLLSFKIVSL